MSARLRIVLLALPLLFLSIAGLLTPAQARSAEHGYATLGAVHHTHGRLNRVLHPSQPQHDMTAAFSEADVDKDDVLYATAFLRMLPSVGVPILASPVVWPDVDTPRTHRPCAGYPTGPPLV